MIGTREEHLTYLREEMCEDPQMAMIIYEIMNKVKKGDFKPKLVLDAIVQRWERYNLDELDIFYISKIYAGIITGKIGMIQIEMYRQPLKDSMIDENNNILSTLPDPFKAKFSPLNGSGDSNDGFFKWDTSISFETQLHSNEGRINKDLLVSEDNIPLEVGYTEAMTTYLHIVRHRGVARYPYDSTKILVFYNNGLDYCENIYKFH